MRVGEYLNRFPIDYRGVAGEFERVLRVAHRGNDDFIDGWPRCFGLRRYRWRCQHKEHKHAREEMPPLSVFRG
ncbi:hypothetical protein MnTg04_00971 [bacterium MnTg04]|nr:hypothetical protein MnTg04_00971 [bacterium MnTg04]